MFLSPYTYIHRQSAPQAGMDRPRSTSMTMEHRCPAVTKNNLAQDAIAGSVAYPTTCWRQRLADRWLEVDEAGSPQINRDPEEFNFWRISWHRNAPVTVNNHRPQGLEETWMSRVRSACRINTQPPPLSRGRSAASWRFSPSSRLDPAIHDAKPEIASCRGWKD